MTGHRIKVSGVKLVDGKLIKKPTYASISDKLKRGDRKKKENGYEANAGDQPFGTRCSSIGADARGNGKRAQRGDYLR